MRLAGLRAGDIVRVHDGLPYLAEVIGQDGARVRVAPITGPKGIRTVTSRDVVEHWRMARSRGRRRWSGSVIHAFRRRVVPLPSR
jgi:hypothetical protein